MENAVKYEITRAGSVTTLPAPGRRHGGRIADGSRIKPMLPRNSVRTQPVRERGRRVLNVIVAGLALLVLAPILLMIAALVRFTSRGPVLYKQLRVGLDRRTPDVGDQNHRRQIDYGGRLFKIYKFRTMYTDGNEPSHQVWATPDDPRVTPIGRVLRKYRLDELPQLVNVLLGDMNIVGPRPEQPDIFMDLRTQVESYAHRQRVLPGITGWAQIQHSYDTSVEDVRRKVELDLEYIQRRSWSEDLRIMARTLPVITFQQGAW